MRMAAFEESLTRKARYKTRLRTIRLPVSIDTALEEEAEKRGMTMNSFVVSILERYAEWDMLAEKFRFIAFPIESVREEYSLIKDQASLKRLARDLGAKIPRELMLFWFKEVNIESFLRYLTLQSKFQSYAQYEVVHHGEKIVIIAKHQVGPNWSVWLAAYLEEAIRSNLGVVPRVESTDNTVKIEFEKC
jgi:hypothetical protein